MCQVILQPLCCKIIVSVPNLCALGDEPELEPAPAANAPLSCPIFHNPWRWKARQRFATSL